MFGLHSIYQKLVISHDIMHTFKTQSTPNEPKIIFALQIICKWQLLIKNQISKA